MKEKNNVLIQNRQARFNYELTTKYIAGIQLKGTEIKSIRNTKASIAEAFCLFVGGNLILRNMYIEEYKHASFYNHDCKRDRVLLLTKKEIKDLRKHLEIKGYTIIPLNLFINTKGLAKVTISLGRGKKLVDKRESIKKRDLDRETQKMLKQM